MKAYSLFSLACLVMFSLTFSAHGEEWPQYRGPVGDGKSAESIDDHISWKGGPAVVWKSETPLGFSSFCVAENLATTLIAIDEKEYCLALDARTGEELWRAPLGSNAYNGGGGNAGAPGNRGGDGPRSTPASDGQNVFVYDSHLVLYSLDAASGKVNWKHDVVAENAGRNIKWSNATSPLLDGSKIYLSGGGPGQSFLAFDKNSGKVLWKSGDELMTHATPSIGTVSGSKQLVYFMQSGLVGVDPESGTEKWRAKFDFSVSTAASPVLFESMVYCSAGYGVGAALFNITGAKEADELWYKPNELMNHWSSPLIKDGYLYGVYEFKKYGKAPLQCVNLKTGEIVWSERGFGPGNCILVGDKLVVLSDTGEVAIVKASPDGYNELARAKVIDGKCWSTPAFSDGKIFVRSTTEAACIDVSSF
ncbi:MAG: PQQ-binding-like beta-propeller repeat protein [Planctomycetota bacterium]